MNNFDLLGNHISEMCDVMDVWIAKLGYSYNHFAVLYSLSNAEKDNVRKNKFAMNGICRSRRYLTFVKNIEKKAGSNSTKVHMINVNE